MKIMRQSLLLAASMLIANTSFCPPIISGTDEEIVIPDNVSMTKQNIAGAVLAMPLSLIASSDNSLINLGITLATSFGAIYLRVKGNSYYDHARKIALTDEENASYTKWGSALQALGYLCSGICISKGIQYYLKASWAKNPIQTMDTMASKVITPITFGKMDRAFCQKYHIGAGAVLLGANVTAGILEDKAVNTKLGKQFSKEGKKIAGIEDLN